MRPSICADRVDDLNAYLFGPDRALLASEARVWLSARPFRAFAETYRDKIRKKARGTRDEEAQRDLAFELAVAARLVGDRRFAVEYEPYGVGQRAPDLRVTFRGGLRFNVEVKRLRPSDPARGTVAVARTLSTKLGQLRPGMVNVLVLGCGHLSSDLVPAAMAWLEHRAAERDEELFRERGFGGTRDFVRHYQRLSSILWIDGGSSGSFLNGRARHPLPADLARALGRL